MSQASIYTRVMSCEPSSHILQQKCTTFQPAFPTSTIFDILNPTPHQHHGPNPTNKPQYHLSSLIAACHQIPRPLKSREPWPGIPTAANYLKAYSSPLRCAGKTSKPGTPITLGSPTRGRKSDCAAPCATPHGADVESYGCIGKLRQIGYGRR